MLDHAADGGPRLAMDVLQESIVRFAQNDPTKLSAK